MNQRSIIRIGIIGCGKITDFGHLPAVLSSNSAKLTTLVDANLDNARFLKGKYGYECSLLDDYRKCLGAVDAVIIATPNHMHFEIAKYFLENNVHVLLEKPLTINLNEADTLCEVSEKKKCVLAVGYVTRFFPSTNIMKELIDKNYFGEIKSFDYQFGGRGGWSPLSGYNLSKDSAGGGVLLISGTHFIDRMLFWFGWPNVIEAFSDSHGGVESNFQAKFCFKSGTNEIIGNMVVSKTYKLRNTFRLNGSEWDAELSEGCADSILLKLKKMELSFDFKAYSDETGNRKRDYIYFYEQFENFVNSIITGEKPRVDGIVGSKSVRLISEMYSKALPMQEQWLLPKKNSSISVSDLKKEKILITGASGFVGGSLCERLYFEKKYDFKAMIHSTGSASRIARLPIEIVQADLLNKEEINEALQGCSMIVNLVRGGKVVDTKGLENLLMAAMKNGIKKLVHLSSVAVYGDNPPEGSQDESCPANPGDNKYGRLKLEQEILIQKYVKRGLSAIILRPPNIYGPFSMFTMAIMDRIKSQNIYLLDDGRNPCNIVHVYNLVEAIILSLESEHSKGKAYFITDDDPVTWKEFIEEHVNLLGKKIDINTISTDELKNIKVIRTTPKRSATNVLQFLASGELRSVLSRNIPVIQNINDFLYSQFQRMDPGLQHKIKMKLSRPDSITKIGKDLIVYDQFLYQQNRRIRHSIQRAKKDLKYSPRFNFKTGMENTYHWLKSAMYLNDNNNL